VIQRFLEIYLNDHAAAAAAGSTRAARLAKAAGHEPEQAELRVLAEEIAEDRDSLLSVMRAVGARRNPLKMVLARAGELAGLAKLNHRLLRRSPLGVLLDLELLRGGVEAKRQLWETLRIAHPQGVAGVDFAALAVRSVRHAEVLEARHADAVRTMLASR
jgi:hypothetical protein